MVFGSTESEDKPLEWEILDYDEKNKKVLLISRYIVDTLKYNSSTKKNAWASSTLRSYLNGDFIAKSFSKSEQALISSVKLENKTRQGTKEKATEDKIYILSYAELLKYFPVPYFNEKKTDSDICYYSWVSLDMKNECGSIWLRTYDEEEETIMLVNSCGAIDEEGDEADTSKGVRPVLWLNLY